jgi:N-acetylmuramoyl-L-alanine amidase
MATHKVEEGQTLYTIAHSNGFANWRTIYDHPSNEELRAKRPNPQVLQPGDIIQIPDPPPDEAIAVALDARTVLRRTKKGFQTVRFTVLDTDMAPVASAEYELSFNSENRKGKTDERGTLQESIPVDVADIMLKVNKQEWKLAVGHLHPIDPEADDKGMTGAKARLRNLGYFVTNVDGNFGNDVQQALRRFQADNGLPTTGRLDDATSDKLVAIHES